MIISSFFVDGQHCMPNLVACQQKIIMFSFIFVMTTYQAVSIYLDLKV